MRRLQWTIGCQVMGDFEFELYAMLERTGELGWIFYKYFDHVSIVFNHSHCMELKALSFAEELSHVFTM